MTIEEIVRQVETPWSGRMSGVRLLVVGASDGGLLARTLARHSVRVLLVADCHDYDEAESKRPLALDMTIVKCDDYNVAVRERANLFDMVLTLNCDIVMPWVLPTVKIEYVDGEYHKNK